MTIKVFIKWMKSFLMRLPARLRTFSSARDSSPVMLPILIQKSSLKEQPHGELNTIPPWPYMPITKLDTHKMASGVYILGCTYKMSQVKTSHGTKRPRENRSSDLRSQGTNEANYLTCVANYLILYGQDKGMT